MEKNTKFNIAGVIAGIISIIFGGGLLFIQKRRTKVYDDFSNNYETMSDEEFEKTLKLLVKWGYIDDPQTYEILRNHSRLLKKAKEELSKLSDEEKEIIERCEETLARFEKMQEED